MDLKFYLNKFLKIDNIEHYPLGSIYQLRKLYDDFLEKTEGLDPDFPMIDFGGKGQKVKGVNKIQVLGKDGDVGEDITNDFLNF